MPLQVQNLINGRAEYTATVSVPATGEVVTQNALSDTAVALGRRIEYYGAQIPSPLYFTINEDFVNAATDAGGNILTGDAGIWTYIGNSQGWKVFTALPKAAHPGTIANAVNTAMALYPRGGEDSFELARVQRYSCVVDLDSLSTDFEMVINNGTGSAIAGAGVHSISLFYDAGISANWQLRTNNGGAGTNLDTGVPATLAPTGLTIERISGVLIGRVSPNLVRGLDITPVATLPNEALLMTPLIRCLGAVETAVIDHVAFRYATPERGV